MIIYLSREGWIKKMQVLYIQMDYYSVIARIMPFSSSMDEPMRVSY